MRVRITKPGLLWTGQEATVLEDTGTLLYLVREGDATKSPVFLQWGDVEVL